jgi:hypothetical protein
VQRPIDNYNSEDFVDNYHSKIFVDDNYNCEVFGESHEGGYGLSPYIRVRKRRRLRGDYIFFCLPNVIFASNTLVCWHIKLTRRGNQLRQGCTRVRGALNGRVKKHYRTEKYAEDYLRRGFLPILIRLGKKTPGAFRRSQTKKTSPPLKVRSFHAEI